MIAFIIFNLILFIFVLVCLILLSAVWPPDSPWSPWWTTSPEVSRKMFQFAKLKKGQTVYDLGSGTGEALITAAKEYGAKGVGIEIDPLRYLLSKFNARRAGVESKITFINANFFSVPFADADVVLMYLVPKGLARLSPKLYQELKTGTRIICYRYPIPIGLFHGKLIQTMFDPENKIYIYQIKKSSHSKK